MLSVFDDETGGHGGDLARAAKLWNPDRGELVDFSSNINPLGPAPGLLDHLRIALPEIVSYPSPQAREFRERLAAFMGVPVERLIIGNGANELIHLLILWSRPQRVLVPSPSFSEYERAAVLAGARVERYSLPPGNEVDFDALGRKTGPGDLLVFCNPNNPTGMLSPRGGLSHLLETSAGKGASLMVDESFIPLTGRPEESLRDFQSEHLWVITSLTKLWSLPGLRLGCAVGPEKLTGAITRWGDPWRVNILAQKAGIYCLESKGYLEKSLALIKKEREFLTRGFLETGAFHVYEGSANYLLLRGLEAVFNVEDYQDYLARRGVLIRRADNFFGLDQRYFRIAVRTRPENLRLIRETEAYLKSGESKIKNGSAGGENR